MLDYKQLASTYAKHRQVHPEVLKTLLSVSAINPSSKVLEVGCGFGRRSPHAVREPKVAKITTIW